VPLVGAAHAPSPDVRFGLPGLRSLEAACAPPGTDPSQADWSWLRWSATPAPGAWATPRWPLLPRSGSCARLTC